MKLMKERGVKYYDFVGARINPDEGSKYEGIYQSIITPFPFLIYDIPTIIPALFSSNQPTK